jgi:hypothetical protein
LKSLKDLVRQRADLQGSMVEGYISYQSMVDIIQYLPKLESNVNLHHTWDVNSINKFEWGYLLGKGRMRKVKGN